MKRITVKLEDDLYRMFDMFCRERGYKKSGLIVYLVKELLKKEGYLAVEGAPAQVSS